MSPEERQLLQGLFDRMRGSANNPRDREAEALIADNLRQQPYAPYLLSQTVIVQDQALRAANDKLQQLEAQVQQMQGSSAGAPQQPGSGGFLSGIGSLFGGGAAAQPQPQARSPWNQGAPQGGYPQQGGGGYPPPPQQGGPWSGGACPAAGGWRRRLPPRRARRGGRCRRRRAARRLNQRVVWRPQQRPRHRLRHGRHGRHGWWLRRGRRDRGEQLLRLGPR